MPGLHQLVTDLKQRLGQETHYASAAQGLQRMSCSRRCRLCEASSEMDLPSSWEPSHIALACNLTVPALALDAAEAAAAAVLAAASVVVLAAASVVVLAASLGQLAAACPLAAGLLPVTIHAAFAVQVTC